MAQYLDIRDRGPKRKQPEKPPTGPRISDDPLARRRLSELQRAMLEAGWELRFDLKRESFIIREIESGAEVAGFDQVVEEHVRFGKPKVRAVVARLTRRFQANEDRPVGGATRPGLG